jgi:hypothetical protein
VLRVLAASVMLAALMGPTPGNVGGCGAGSTVADPAQHCTDKQFWLCRRDQFAGRISDGEFVACRDAVAGMCGGATWPAGCMPSRAQSEACINLLQRGDIAHLTNPEILSMYADCNLCP